jgi:hypothetical protein
LTVLAPSRGRGLENARLGSVPEPLGAAELPVGAGAGSTAGLERCDLRGGPPQPHCEACMSISPVLPAWRGLGA